MLERQDSLVASKSRRRGENEPVVMKSTGCMSGIIQLISKYQKKTKRLTSGRKQCKVVEHVKEELKAAAAAARSPKMQAVKKEPVALVEEISCPPNNRKLLESLSSSTELKRRKLVEALDKCNDDLQSIRNVLNSLKNVTHISHAMRAPTPSPKHNGHITQQRIKRLGAYKPVDKFTNNAPLFHMKPKSCSKGMIQSVEEVWNECEWGQKREAGIIGLILQDHIYRDLIEELLKEMDLLISFHSLPFFACRKRLVF